MNDVPTKRRMFPMVNNIANRVGRKKNDNDYMSVECVVNRNDTQ